MTLPHILIWWSPDKSVQDMNHLLFIGVKVYVEPATFFGQVDNIMVHQYTWEIQ